MVSVGHEAQSATYHIRVSLYPHAGQRGAFHHEYKDAPAVRTTGQAAAPAIPNAKHKIKRY